MKSTVLGLLSLALLGLLAQPASAQGGSGEAAKPASQAGTLSVPHATKIDRLRKADRNAWTVGLAGGLIEGTFLRYAADLAKVLDDGDNLRVIPMVTYGAVGNVTDLLDLRGVDVAITEADGLDYFRREVNLLDIDDRIRCVSPLFLALVHVYAM